MKKCDTPQTVRARSRKLRAFPFSLLFTRHLESRTYKTVSLNDN
jgi:hypothetical protein